MDEHTCGFIFGMPSGFLSALNVGLRLNGLIVNLLTMVRSLGISEF